MIPLQQPRAPAYNHPRGDLLQRDRRSQYINSCVPLYKAMMEGEWETAKYILQDKNYLLGFSITEKQEMPLHIAIMAPDSTEFVIFLVDLMTRNMNDLRLRNGEGNTALCLAAIAGNVKMAKILVERNRELLTIFGSQDMMPLHLAAVYDNHDMVNYLYNECRQMTRDDWTDIDRNKVLLKCIEVDLFDVALRMLNDDTHLPQGKYVWEVLHALARKPCAFDDIEPHIIWKTINSIFHLNVGPAIRKSEATQILTKIWEEYVGKPKNEIDEMLRGPMIIDNNGMPTYPSRILFVAAEMGNARFLIELIREYHDLIWKRNDNGQNIFHVAVSHRHERIYSILYEISSIKDLITPLTDKEGNNMLHLAGMTAEKNPYEDLLTAPFQMQRELLWFKEVKARIPPSYREVKNSAGRTPSELFTSNHKDLVSQSKKWMKETTNQCLVAAVLISAIGFSVVSTIPGGYDQNNGYPQFLDDEHLIVFVIFNAISFILSSISILMFLSIVVSRYTQTDFLESLPQNLSIGLATLFLSILTMMIAFGVSFFILYHQKLMVVPFIIWALGTIPVILYSKLQYPLLVDVFHSRYGSRDLFKPKKHMLYNRNTTF